MRSHWHTKWQSIWAIHRNEVHHFHRSSQQRPKKETLVSLQRSTMQLDFVKLACCQKQILHLFAATWDPLGGINDWLESRLVPSANELQRLLQKQLPLAVALLPVQQKVQQGRPENYRCTCQACLYEASCDWRFQPHNILLKQEGLELAEASCDQLGDKWKQTSGEPDTTSQSGRQLNWETSEDRFQ